MLNVLTCVTNKVLIWTVLVCIWKFNSGFFFYEDKYHDFIDVCRHYRFCLFAAIKLMNLKQKLTKRSLPLTSFWCLNLKCNILDSLYYNTNCIICINRTWMKGGLRFSLNLTPQRACLFRGFGWEIRIEKKLKHIFRMQILLS